MVRGFLFYVNANKNAFTGAYLRVFDIDGKEIAITSVTMIGVEFKSTRNACKVLDYKGILIVRELGWSPTIPCKI